MVPWSDHVLMSLNADMTITSGCSGVSRGPNDVAELDSEGLHRILKWDL